ncbi:hypothetical protein [Nocardia sp. XZ_19_369]|uniref:hypothetical protein n=1 Tax=Nocardia sp. XZ_19_369 TaxID=2769487 RepID=UPI00188EF7D7|nr:hypothetical protein [Nocardia sp. XZ_19_369]
MNANEDLRQVADLLEAATIGSVRLALAQSPQGPQRNRSLPENLDAAAGVLDRHRHLQEASMAITLAHAIYQSEAAKLALNLPRPAAGEEPDVSTSVVEQVNDIARRLLSSPAGSDLHQLGRDLAAIAEGRR